MKFTEEQLAKIKAAKTAEELIAIAKAEGIEATEEQIKAQFDAMHKEGELADDELNNVAGGCGGTSTTPMYRGHPVCDSDWAPCEGIRINRCKQCIHFHYQNPGDNVGNCDGYCTKG